MEAGVSAGQGSGDAQVQGATSEAQGAAGRPAGQAGSDGGTASTAELQAKIEQLERDNRQYRDAQRAREEAEKAAQEAQLSEAERVTKRQAALELENADLKRQLLDERTQRRVVESATRAGFSKPELAWKLIELSAIEYDADGRPRNIDKLVNELLREYPELSSATARVAGSAEGGVRGNGSGGADMNTMIRQAAGRA